MPKSPFRRKPSAHGESSLLRYVFPHTRARARDRLSKLRHETFPSFKHRAQSRIYKYIVSRQTLKLAKKPSILQRLRGHTRRLTSTNYLEDEARLRRREIAKDPIKKATGLESPVAGGGNWQDISRQRMS
jgi:hypothetical protein